jgi:uncharacterized membrane protein
VIPAQTSAPRGRIAGLDAARGLAVAAMFFFHLVWDLGNFGYIDPLLPYSQGVKLLGHAIALSFLVIAGVSLVLAQEKSAPRRGYARRLLTVFGAAALVSAGTYAVFPDAYVFFGILHCIGAASLLAAPLLRGAWPLSAAAALVFLAAPSLIASPLFDAPWLQWVGLGTFEPLTNDYRPVFPWAGALFAGVAAGQFAQGAVIPAWRGAAPKPLVFLGRHSLALYLLHQPVFFAIFTALALVFPTPAAPPTESFLAACARQCAAGGREASYCAAACACVAAEAEKDELLRSMTSQSEKATRIGALAQRCVAPTK